MNAAVVTWRVLRVARWILWLAVIAIAIYLLANRQVLFSFGRLKPSMELFLFALGGAPVLVGLLEMMMRDRAGIPRRPSTPMAAPAA